MGFNHTFMIIIPITILHFLPHKSKSTGMWDVFGLDFTLDILLKRHMVSSSYSAYNWFCWGRTLCSLYPSNWKHYVLRIISKNDYMDLIISSYVLCVDKLQFYCLVSGFLLGGYVWLMHNMHKKNCCENWHFD